MAAVKAKTPVSKKLKAGQKKKTNKWLIVGGIAAVAIIGAVVVRFSSASTWRVLYQYNTGGSFKLGGGGSTAIGAGTPALYLRSGSNFRVCAKGYTNKSTAASLKLSFSTQGSAGRYGVAASTKKYGKSNQLHCSATFHTTKNYNASGKIDIVSGSMTVTSFTIEELR